MITKEEVQEFIALGERLFELYHKLPQNGSKRKIAAGCDRREWGYNLIMFQGPKEDILKVQKFINEVIAEEK